MDRVPEQYVYCITHDELVVVTVDDDYFYLPDTCHRYTRGCSWQYESSDGAIHTTVSDDQWVKMRLIEAGGGRRP